MFCLLRSLAAEGYVFCLLQLLAAAGRIYLAKEIGAARTAVVVAPCQSTLPEAGWHFDHAGVAVRRVDGWQGQGTGKLLGWLAAASK